MQFYHDIENDDAIKKLDNVFTYIVKVNVQKPTTVIFRVSDAQKPNTLYVNRTRDIYSSQTFYLRMPQSPKTALIQIYNKQSNDPNIDDRNITITQFTKVPLKTKINAVDIDDDYIREFVPFAQWFAENSAIIDSVGYGYGSEYMSDEGGFMIRYVDLIKENGIETNTPTRVSPDNGVIEVSKNKFNNLTVAGRMVFLLHEMSHVYINDNENNEFEADLNALIIYLGLGYPRVEAEEAFRLLFQQADTPENQKRLQKISSFIKNFDKANFELI